MTTPNMLAKEALLSDDQRMTMRDFLIDVVETYGYAPPFLVTFQFFDGESIELEIEADKIEWASGTCAELGLGYEA